MQNMKHKVDDNSEVAKPKERHIVTWSKEEDGILREQIRINGTENWAIIASKFKDKTTRQCRRRWYTYLNSDFKKGGWSPEEDMLLCEAQKIFGNRWTEIAKVVSGRTDNAVKNRFSTLCKKRAKHEALAKENTSCINPNNKRVLCQNGFNTDGISETEAPLKKMRIHVSNLTEKSNHGEIILKDCATTNQQLRPPFAVLVQNFHNLDDLPTQHHVSIAKECSDDASNNKTRTFLKKDDPRIFALMQQAELLSSLAAKVNTENTHQSLEIAWKILQDFLNQTKGSDLLRFGLSDMDSQFENFKYLVEDLRSSNEGSQSSCRQPALHESPCSSEYSTGSTLLSNTTGDRTEQSQHELCALHQDIGVQSIHIGDQINFGECPLHQDIGVELQSIPTGERVGVNECESRILSGETTNQEFSSPLQVTPLFRSLAAGIPSPKFSESERHFLLKTLGMESPSSNPTTNRSDPPPCKRALLHSL
ncbi:transcription factor MYB124 isoform X2 [Cornus florida]|uniref:transcription factor MYB124 isoform X2 n=1 Tax=Cornus florida TaxID=4283 RepID=UPI0028969594|nr:transcription factor MYB124 isoform X2 [Cornus florida]